MAISNCAPFLDLPDPVVYGEAPPNREGLCCIEFQFNALFQITTAPTPPP